MYHLIHPSSFFIGLFAFRPFKILSGVTATLICSAGHDRPSRACSAPSSMPNDLKYKVIVAESCRGVQVEKYRIFDRYFEKPVRIISLYKRMVQIHYNVDFTLWPTYSHHSIEAGRSRQVHWQIYGAGEVSCP